MLTQPGPGHCAMTAQCGCMQSRAKPRGRAEQDGAAHGACTRIWPIKSVQAHFSFSHHMRMWCQVVGGSSTVVSGSVKSVERWVPALGPGARLVLFRIEGERVEGVWVEGLLPWGACGRLISCGGRGLLPRGDLGGTSRPVRGGLLLSPVAVTRGWARYHEVQAAWHIS